MGVLSKLEPEKVFKYFEEICMIPHGSSDTKAISDYLVDFAKKHNLKHRREASNNVIIWKDASDGYEAAPTVMLQGHIDMVCEKDADCQKDMAKEGLELFVEGDVIGARGTTLGGDDGIAVAMALAVLESDELLHGPLECLFTVDEEIGMLGARSLDASDLKAKYMLNIDSEAEKVLTVSCAGSIRAVCSFGLKREEYTGHNIKISVSGLKGGHSGEEIHLGRANSNIILGRILCEIADAADMRIISVRGGSKDNAIPREAEAVIRVDNKTAVGAVISELKDALHKEYETADPDISISMEEVKSEEIPFDADSTLRIRTFLFCAPWGVQNMSSDIAGLVQTSLNMGQVSTEGETVYCRFMMRSSVNSQNQELLKKVTTLCNTLGGSIEVPAAYGAWEYRPDSVLRNVMIDAFRDVYGDEPKVSALHAGLECGILSEKMPHLDCISFGPDLTDIHTPRERLHIASTRRTWVLLVETLKRLK